ncbi:hypothetical protein PENSPDRAFT_106589 [Peniophora sp. CONT]|nr:hypothetical protein PENSPDRAFT_106589 [Peniophora sp. CONT]
MHSSSPRPGSPPVRLALSRPPYANIFWRDYNAGLEHRLPKEGLLMTLATRSQETRKKFVRTLTATICSFVSVVSP